MTRYQLDSMGVSFQFVTPVLLCIVGFLMVYVLASIDKRFDKMEGKFDAFFAYQQTLEKRVDRLEYNRGPNDTLRNP